MSPLVGDLLAVKQSSSAPASTLAVAFVAGWQRLACVNAELPGR